MGLMFTLARIWDVITDPTIGHLMDWFPSRWASALNWPIYVHTLALIPSELIFRSITWSPTYG